MLKKINYKKVNKNFKVPEKATNKAVAFDVRATNIEVKANNKVYCKLGFCAKVDDNHKIILVPRSGLTKTNWIMNNSPGQGDPDYSGEYEIRFTAIPTGIKRKWTWKFPFIKSELTYDPFPYKVGERIGQVFIQSIIPTVWSEDENLTWNSNRKGGFNSTGTE